MESKVKLCSIVKVGLKENSYIKMSITVVLTNYNVLENKIYNRSLYHTPSWTDMWETRKSYKIFLVFQFSQCSLS